MQIEDCGDGCGVPADEPLEVHRYSSHDIVSEGRDLTRCTSRPQMSTAIALMRISSVHDHYKVSHFLSTQLLNMSGSELSLDARCESITNSMMHREYLLVYESCPGLTTQIDASHFLPFWP